MALRRPSAPLDDQGTAGRGPRLETLEPCRERWGRPAGDWVAEAFGVDFLNLPLGGVALRLALGLALPLVGAVRVFVSFGLSLGMKGAALEGVAVGFFADAAGEVPASAAGLRGGVKERTRWGGTERDPFTGAWVLDDSGVDGRERSRGLTGFGVGVSGDFTADFLRGTGAETRRDTFESLGRLEKLG